MGRKDKKEENNKDKEIKGMKKEERQGVEEGSKEKQGMRRRQHRKWKAWKDQGKREALCRSDRKLFPCSKALGSQLGERGRGSSDSHSLSHGWAFCLVGKATTARVGVSGLDFRLRHSCYPVPWKQQ